MTRINSALTERAILEWAQRNQEQIQTHPAWHSNISEAESEKLLRDKNAFTYLLRSGEKEHFYFISFVKEGGSIKHQFFALEFDRKGWYYRNGGQGSLQEAISQDISKLISMMMHCDLRSCTPLTSA
ncbi:MAG: hypothetical protein HYZ47_03455 [Simkania negevensis]|nr:hypothetical protein [Simkania negevensis]